ncbi:MAG: ABC transporter permease [Microthrixaceae bacterium]
MTDVSTKIEIAEEAGPTAKSGQLRRGIGAILASFWILLILFIAVGADVLPLADPSVDVGVGSRIAPFTTWPEFLGTDGLGRSMLSRVVYGARVSLAAGAASVGIAFAFGLAVGVSAGYFRGKVDTVVGVVVDGLLAFPALVFLMALAATLQPGLGTLVVGLSFVAFPPFVRLARANTLQYTGAEFVLATRGLGAKKRTVLMGEIVPNVIPSLVAYASVIGAALILAEASLSFLGLGVRPPTPSWGGMIADGVRELRTEPYLVLVPSAVLFLTIFSLNVVGEYLRSRTTDPSRL